MNREPTEMELRVAEAIHWIGGEVDSADVLEAARAAIRAMREPTDRMLCAAQWAHFDSPNPPVQACVDAKINSGKAWAAMIDAASPCENKV